MNRSGRMTNETKLISQDLLRALLSGDKSVFNLSMTVGMEPDALKRLLSRLHNMGFVGPVYSAGGETWAIAPAGKDEISDLNVLFVPPLPGYEPKEAFGDDLGVPTDDEGPAEYELSPIGTQEKLAELAGAIEERERESMRRREAEQALQFTLGDLDKEKADHKTTKNSLASSTRIVKDLRRQAIRDTATIESQSRDLRNQDDMIVNLVAERDTATRNLLAAKNEASDRAWAVSAVTAAMGLEALKKGPKKTQTLKRIAEINAIIDPLKK